MMVMIIKIIICCKEYEHAVGVLYSCRTLAADALQRVRRESGLTEHSEK